MAPAPELSDVRTAFLAVSGYPFGVAAAPSGSWSFVSMIPTGIWVLSDRTFAPKRVRLIHTQMNPAGETLTRDGRYLLAAAGSGAVVVSVARAERGSAAPLLGTLSIDGRHDGAIEVITSPDDRFAFVTLEDSDEIAVYDLHEALSSDFRTSGFVGTIPLGASPVGMAISPDGRWLYVTSELASSSSSAQTGPGTLSVIDLHHAETTTQRSVIATVLAGCNPVRVAVSPDGSTVWVTARESDALLGFASSELLTDPAHALIADVQVGEAPVGLAIIDHGTRIVVADSNRFKAPGASAALTVVNTAAALAGQPAVLGSVIAGFFPREEAIEPDGTTLLVTNFGAHQLEAVDTTHLP